MSFQNKAMRLLSLYEAKSQPLPRVTLGAVNRDGTFRYVEKFGGVSDSEDVDAVHYLASSTKFVTTVAVLQCVEKGLLDLDEDISTVLPEFESAKILTGFTKTNDAIFALASGAITLRRMLTHSSGLAYLGMESLLLKYDAIYHRPFVNTTVENSFHNFLVFEPGQRWMYSTGVDWAGVAVERVTSMKLGAYMQRHIFEPVAVTNTTFHMEERPDLKARRAKYWHRVDGGLGEKALTLPDPIEGDLGGAGLYSTVSDMLKIYQGILTGELLRSATVEQMFTPQLEITDGLDQPSEWSLPFRNAIYNTVPNDTPVNFGLGGLLNLAPVPGRRGTHSLTWSGKPNIYWWIDVHKGVAGVFLCQLEPTGDPNAIELLTDFEKFVYASLATN